MLAVVFDLLPGVRHLDDNPVNFGDDVTDVRVRQPVQAVDAVVILSVFSILHVFGQGGQLTDLID